MAKIDPILATVYLARRLDLSTKEGKSSLFYSQKRWPKPVYNKFGRFRDAFAADGFMPAAANLKAVEKCYRLHHEVRSIPEEVVGAHVATGVQEESVSVDVPCGTVDVEGDEKPNRVRRESDFATILRAVRKRCRGKKSAGLGDAVAWVAENVAFELTDLDEGEIPSPEALAQWRWAHDNETEWRKTYDAKRVPAKGFAADTELGFVDDGEAVESIRRKIAEGVDEITRSLRDGRLRDLQGTTKGRGGGAERSHDEAEANGREPKPDDGQVDGSVRGPVPATTA